jgi:hypothetical protein
MTKLIFPHEIHINLEHLHLLANNIQVACQNSPSNMHRQELNKMEKQRIMCFCCWKLQHLFLDCFDYLFVVDYNWKDYVSRSCASRFAAHAWEQNQWSRKLVISQIKVYSVLCPSLLLTWFFFSSEKRKHLNFNQRHHYWSCLTSRCKFDDFSYIIFVPTSQEPLQASCTHVEINESLWPSTSVSLIFYI